LPRAANLLKTKIINEPKFLFYGISILTDRHSLAGKTKGKLHHFGLDMFVIYKLRGQLLWGLHSPRKMATSPAAHYENESREPCIPPQFMHTSIFHWGIRGRSIAVCLSIKQGN